MGDLIDRQDAIDRINKQREHLRPDIYSQDKICDAAYRICAEFIERLPSAQPERKKGKWLPDNNNYIEERFICSACGRSYKVDTCMGKPMWDFCPCGADMRGEQDGN